VCIRFTHTRLHPTSQSNHNAPTISPHTLTRPHLSRSSSFPYVPPADLRLHTLQPEAVYRLIGDAGFLVLSSECYENFPRVAIEALAKGTPVIASRLGAMAEVVADGRTGLHFEPGNAADLAATVRRFVADPAVQRQMRQAARAEFEEKFTAAINYRTLMAIYERAGAAV